MEHSHPPGCDPVRTSLVLSELLQRFLQARNNDPFKNPLDHRDENHFKRVASLSVERFGDIDISQIAPAALEEFKIFLVKQPGRGGQLFSRSYCNSLLKYLKSMLFWAVQQNFLTEARGFALSKVSELRPSPKIRENKRRKNAPPAHVEELLEKLRQDRPDAADPFELQSIHGMRTGEAVGVRPSMIDFDYDLEGGNWLYEPEKHKTAGRGEPRTFVFCRRSQEIVNKYLDASADPDEPIFRNLRGRPFSVCVFATIIRETIEKYGLKKIVPYQTRHNAATKTAKEFGIKHAQALLGHKSEAMTRHYIHEEGDRIRELAERRNRERGYLDFPPPSTPTPFPHLRLVSGG